MIGNILIVIATVVGMELFAWWGHKYIMHGWGWGWHESHHVPTDGPFETNDLYGLIFAGVSIALFVAGSYWWMPLWYVGLGITIYGVLYGIVHDGLVHQRWPFEYFPKSGYLRRLVQAHKLHHAVQTKEGAVSFGFLFAPEPHKLKAELNAMKQAD